MQIGRGTVLFLFLTATVLSFFVVESGLYDRVFNPRLPNQQPPAAENLKQVAEKQLDDLKDKAEDRNKKVLQNEPGVGPPRQVAPGFGPPIVPPPPVAPDFGPPIVPQPPVASGFGPPIVPQPQNQPDQVASASVKEKKFQAGNGQKTLEYWNQRIKIQGEHFAKLKRPKSWRSAKDKATFSEKYASAAKGYITEVSKLDIAEIDGELLDTVHDHILLMRKFAEAWMMESEAIRTRDAASAETTMKKIDEISEKAGNLLHVRMTELRQSLSKRYSLSFPHYEPDQSTSPEDAKGDDKPAGKVWTPPSETKISAAARLKLARDLIKAGKYNRARYNLDLILRDYRKSDEAKEAEKLWKEIEGKKEE